MNWVISFWIILIIVVVVQVGAIIHYVKGGERVTSYGIYSNKVKDNVKVVIDAIMLGKIKKHLLSNSAEKYDSGKTLEQYRIFLDSDLMKDIMHICEERYNG